MKAKRLPLPDIGTTIRQVTYARPDGVPVRVTDARYERACVGVGVLIDGMLLDDNGARPAGSRCWFFWRPPEQDVAR